MKSLRRTFVTQGILCSAVVCLGIGGSLSTFAESPITRELGSGEVKLQAVAEAMDKAVASKEVAGSVTIVVGKNGIEHIYANGLADVKAGRSMQSDSLFWIASMSKPLAGTSMMILVDEGKVSLDDPITKYLPEMKALRDRDNKEVVITVRQLLSHTSGMSEPKSDVTYSFKNLEEAAAAYAKLPVQFTPGSKWQYSQTSINTAARIVEVVSGSSYDAFLAKRVFEPLKMVDTSFYLTDAQYARLAKSYKKLDNGDQEESPIFLLSGKSPTSRDRFPAANGGLFSTAKDYARFCSMLLGDGQLDGVKVLSPKAVETLRTISTGDLKTGFTDGNGWGVGCCVVREPQGVSGVLSPGSFGHGGAYGTQAWIDPVKKRAYILMVQRSNFPNSDASDVRKQFQEAVAKSLEVK